MKLMTKEEVFELLESFGTSLKSLNIKADVHYAFNMLKSDLDWDIANEPNGANEFYTYNSCESVLCKVPTEGTFKFLNRLGMYRIKGKYVIISDGTHFFFSHGWIDSVWNFKPQGRLILGESEMARLKGLSLRYKFNIFGEQMRQALDDSYWYWYARNCNRMHMREDIYEKNNPE